jgi:hypothetical protein
MKINSQKSNNHTSRPINAGLLSKIMEDVNKQIILQKNLLEKYKPIIEKAIRPAIEAFNENKPTSHIIEPSIFANNSKMTVKNAELIAQIVTRNLKNERQNKKKTKIKIYHNSDLEFYRNPREKHKTEVSGNIQIAILKALTYEFTPCEQIQVEVDSVSTESVRKAIGVLNSKAKHQLHLKDNFIESNRGLGYRLNSKYKLIFS